MTTIFTIGHSTRSLDALISLIADNGVTGLVDVRSYPRSRHNPQFNAETLAAGLADAGIAYHHMKALGGMRGRQPLDAPSPNTLWPADGFRNYADYAMGPEFAAALAALGRIANDRPAAVMCAEARWRDCHRQIIADYLLAATFEVCHILDAGRCQPGRLTPGAVTQPGGAIHYPGEQGELF